MKKICFITTISGTLQSFVLNTAIYLHEHTDWDITFICNDDPGFAASLPEYIHYIPVTMERGISATGFKAMARMRRIFKEQHFDLIQYSTPNAACYASIAGRFAGVPVRLYCQWGLAYVGMSGLKRTVFKLIEKMVCRLSTWVEPDSFGNLDFSHSEGLYPDSKGSVIWHGSASGVSLNKFDISRREEWRAEIRSKHAIPADAPAFIFVGRITRDKGINELLQAWKRLSAKYADARLILVGNLENEELLDAELLRWSQEDPAVIYAGYSNEVEKYFAASEVYVLPSYREGFGSAVVEAEAMGLPVIVTDIPGPTDAMQRDVTGLTVAKADAADLQRAMETLLTDVPMRTRMGAAAFEWASQNFEQQQLFAHILEDRKTLLGD